MKLFDCQICGHTLNFENTRCEGCGSRLGYVPDDRDLHAIVPVEVGSAELRPPPPTPNLHQLRGRYLCRSPTGTMTLQPIRRSATD